MYDTKTMIRFCIVSKKMVLPPISKHSFGNAMRNRGLILLHGFFFVTCFVASTFFPGFAVKAQNKAPLSVPIPFTDTFPQEIEAHKVFEAVKEVRLYVCNYRSGKGLPPLLKPDALAQEELAFLKTWGRISYADGQKHEPLVITNQACEALYDPAMEDPGSLNLVVKVFPVTKYPSEIPHSFAIITRFIYRPDHENKLATLLRADPFFIWSLAADERTLRDEIGRTIGWPANYSYRQKRIFINDLLFRTVFTPCR